MKKCCPKFIDDIINLIDNRDYIDYFRCQGKRRKKRTSIENNVRYSLERAFVANPKPSSEEIKAIGDSLHMEKEVVRVWFCNRYTSMLDR